jgi:hypothetical protein
MQYVLAMVVVAGLSLVYGRIWLERRRDAPLRREIRARDITFRVALEHVTVIRPGLLQPGGDFGVAIQGPVDLVIRGDAFEISSAVPLCRVVMGLEYYFRASETSVELNWPIPRIYGIDTKPRLVMRGRHEGKKIQLRIEQKNLQEIWNAVMAAGAVPGGAWITPTKEG